MLTNADAGSNGYWRPASHGLPVLGTMFCISVGLIVILQYLAWKGQNEGGLLFASTVRDFSLWQTFVHLYLPVVITILYGLGWTWIDLSVKRLESYFALSQPQGSTADSSILLDYTWAFIAWAPIKAIQRR